MAHGMCVGGRNTGVGKRREIWVNGQQFAMNNVLFNAGMSSDSEEDESSSESDDSRDRGGKIMETNLMTSQNYFNQS